MRTVPLSGSSSRSSITKIDSAAARPRCSDALIPDSALRRSSNVKSATVYAMNVGRSSLPDSLCPSAIQMMTATASTARICVIGELAALAEDCFDIELRSELAALTARSRSYASPPKIRTMRWPPIISTSTCVIAPVRVCTSRAIRRSRRLKYRITTATTGRIRNVQIVSRQLK